ncbi:OGG1 like 8-oxoguanine DNA glycosylase involved in DNA repair [Cryptosporidium sp. chipmunk genotype I]|uniref:OGG1 like 8-oxoguanine DNA glycosylase involved in DNA repair n=1 Tax=Cryptosporidium sp. chipmunk genotype I TaxID=1280935 RepID=UPI00351A0F81|nr:OGG1 like 8-oxoguanine DNA glycosylase involved in DNA repair [Cryptosporidium sp. chipmunk genotype I]
MNQIKFESLKVSREELRISKCLPAGQSFSWRKVSKDSFVGILGHRVFQLKELENDTLYRCLYDGCSQAIKDERLEDDEEIENIPLKKNKVAKNEKNVLVPNIDDNLFKKGISANLSAFHCCKSTPNEHIRHYLNLDFNWENESKVAELENPIHSLSEAYMNWNEADSCISSSPKGIRLLNIDPIEALFVGVITANNNISRITSIVKNMRKNLGTFLCNISDSEIISSNEADESEIDIDYHYFSFPTSLQILNSASEEMLREKCGVGYRAKSIISISKELNQSFENDWMFVEHIKSLDYSNATLYLQKFHGIGQKVADFVLLSGFGFSAAVPVDTHILKYICKHMKCLNVASSLSKNKYVMGAQYFRDRFRLLPGWAQLVLFSSSVLK